MKKENKCRAVAYFDVMGFKDRIYREGIKGVSNIIETLSDVSEGVKEAEVNLINKKGKSFDDQTIMPILFSDTILFISYSESVAAVFKVLVASAFLLNRAFKNNIPLKGALAYGEFTADFKSDLTPGVFYGRPLVDAHMLSEELHFYGAVLHHSIEQYIECNKSSEEYKKYKFDKLLKEVNAPIKNAGNVKHTLIDWASLDKKEDKNSHLLNGFYKTASGSIRKYVDNTYMVYAQ